MRLKEVYIEGFGGLGPLALSFATGLNLVLGPNEAGKTCLMEFIRALLFGLSKRDRSYLLYRPLDDRPFGGRAVIEKDGEEFALVARFPGAPKVEGNKVYWDLQGAPLYSRVFSLGLNQVSNLALLSGQEMAQHLYSTTLGPLGKAYARAVEELERRREGLFRVRGQKPLINRLLREIREVEVRLSSLKDLPSRYREILKGIGELEAEMERVGKELTNVRRERETWDALSKAYPIFSRLEEVQRLLKGEELPPSFPSQGLKRLEGLMDEIAQLTQGLEETRLRLGPIEEALASPLEGIEVLALEERIQAIKEEWPLIKEMRHRLIKIEDRLSLLKRLVDEGLAYLETEKLPPRPTGAVWERLRGFSREFELLKEERLALEKERDLRHEEERRRRGELETLKEMAPQEPPISRDEVIARLGLVGQAWSHAKAIPSPWEIVAFLLLLLGGMWGMLKGEGPIRWVGIGVILLGIGGIGWTWYRRWRWGKEAKGLAEGLDLYRLTPPLLEATEKKLKEIEDAHKRMEDWRRRCREAEGTIELLAQEMKRLDGVLENLETKERALAQDWEKWLTEIGLSPIYPYRAVQDLLHKVEDLHAARKEQEDLIKERGRILERIEGFQERLSQLISDLGVNVGSWEEGMVIMGRALEDAKKACEERKALEVKAGPLREKKRDLEERLAQRKGELRGLLQEAGVASVEAFRELAQRWEKREALEKEARELRLKLAGLLGRDWEGWVSKLTGLGPGEASLRLEELEEREAELGKERDRLIESKIRLVKEREELEGEGREQELVQKREELIERLREAVNRWTVDTMALMLFKKTREVYEREHQPRVLQEASRLFSTMTGGRYSRVYLPMGEEELWVERSDGHRLSSRYLSRGTGEQLYLSLSMAIMTEVAQRGMVFPVVLDDILVNFDPTRAAKAAKAILSLSDRLQVLYFTCHPHIAQLFKGEKGVTFLQLQIVGDS